MDDTLSISSHALQFSFTDQDDQFSSLLYRLHVYELLFRGTWQAVQQNRDESSAIPSFLLFLRHTVRLLYGDFRIFFFKEGDLPLQVISLFDGGHTTIADCFSNASFSKQVVNIVEPLPRWGTYVRDSTITRPVP